jgi:hypothetical protein
VTEQQLWLDPSGAHDAGVDLAHAGRAITTQHGGLGAEIAAASAGRPWGRDDIGAAFEQNYRVFEAMVLQAWKSVGGYVEGLGTAVVTAVHASVETDVASAGRIRKTV